MKYILIIITAIKFDCKLTQLMANMLQTWRGSITYKKEKSVQALLARNQVITKKDLE